MYVAIRDVMLAYLNEDPWQALKELGVSAIEVAVSRDYRTSSFSGNKGSAFDLNTERDFLKKRLEKNKVKICCLLMSNNFDTGDLKEEINWTVETCRIAKEFSVDVVRIDLATHSKDTDPESFISKATDAVREILSATEATKVSLAMENHGVLANKKEFLDKLLEKVGSGRLGLTLDSGNFYWYGYPLSQVYEIMKYFAKRVKHTHIKNIRYPAEKREIRREIGWEYGKYVSPIHQGDVDHQRVISILKEAGYDGDITIEDESLSKFPKEEQKGVLKKDAAHLKEIISFK